MINGNKVKQPAGSLVDQPPDGLPQDPALAQLAGSTLNIRASFREREERESERRRDIHIVSTFLGSFKLPNEHPLISDWFQLKKRKGKNTFQNHVDLFWELRETVSQVQIYLFFFFFFTQLQGWGEKPDFYIRPKKQLKQVLNFFLMQRRRNLPTQHFLPVFL